MVDALGTHGIVAVRREVECSALTRDREPRQGKVGLAQLSVRGPAGRERQVRTAVLQEARAQLVERSRVGVVDLMVEDSAIG